MPLLQAAHTLLTRLDNVGKFNQIEEFPKLPPRFRDYARYETVYRIARYLCVVHMVWREWTSSTSAAAGTSGGWASASPRYWPTRR